LRERIKVRGILNYEKNHPPPYPLPSREGKYDGFRLMLMQFKFAIKDVWFRLMLMQFKFAIKDVSKFLILREVLDKPEKIEKWRMGETVYWK
jgi:hypothetical protein